MVGCSLILFLHPCGIITTCPSIPYLFYHMYKDMSQPINVISRFNY
jgi:hypothetical protein